MQRNHFLGLLGVAPVIPYLPKPAHTVTGALVTPDTRIQVRWNMRIEGSPPMYVEWDTRGLKPTRENCVKVFREMLEHGGIS